MALTNGFVAYAIRIDNTIGANRSCAYRNRTISDSVAIIDKAAFRTGNDVILKNYCLLRQMNYQTKGSQVAVSLSEGEDHAHKEKDQERNCIHDTEGRPRQ